VNGILVGYDGSAAANTAVELAGTIASASDASVLLVTVVPDVRAIRSAWGALVVGSAADIQHDLVTQAEATLEAPLARLRTSGVQADSVVGLGRAPQVLAEEASRIGASVIVVGSRGLGPIRSTVLGSVSQEIIDLAPCPVLVARGATIARIVLGTDGSPSAQAAEQVLASLPIPGGVPVNVVSVAEVLRPLVTGIAPTMYAEALAWQAEYEAEAERHHLQAAEEAVARLSAAGIEAQAIVRSGDAAAQLLSIADAPTDLIIVGSRGRTGMQRLVLGSVARRVLHHAKGSVLVTKTPAPSH
jgi:nucleotide-binding universal stress UspA family protein